LRRIDLVGDNHFRAREVEEVQIRSSPISTDISLKADWLFAQPLTTV
jgi:hypothetical protein